MPAIRRAVEVAEEFADGLVSVEELSAAHSAAGRARPLYLDGHWAGVVAAQPMHITQAASAAADYASQALGRIAAERPFSTARASLSCGATLDDQKTAWDGFDAAIDAAAKEEQKEHAELLREIIGNPFQAAAPAPAFSPVLVQLAEALYAGADGAFALHDALIEEGHVELAEHFRRPGHPKGCWALDVVLGRG
jgi:hypothetical protein